MTDAAPIDIERIMQFLPHRYPFLLVDRIVDFEAGRTLTAIKNVTVNEPFFPGHFPHRPVMPGVMILEALAQASGILAFLTVDEMPDEDTALYFVGIDKARFRRPVVPGDQIFLHTTFDRRIREIWRFQTEARVAEEVAVTATMMVATKGI
ncbi:MAG: 3-hydroxyacyl-ACP dehydratase FabZ [Chromatiales bacterium]|jgi:3-hydroxyacyl-[acyl-carrier-protein] dehydratase|nr:3-hydroxyacyl-ACP dehydratase FabZ [Chromatiales bacterium]